MRRSALLLRWPAAEYLWLAEHAQDADCVCADDVGHTDQVAIMRLIPKGHHEPVLAEFAPFSGSNDLEPFLQIAPSALSLRAASCPSVM